MHICREIRWDGIDRIERRTIDTGAKYPFDEMRSFLSVKRVTVKKRKNQKRRSAYFYS